MPRTFKMLGTATALSFVCWCATLAVVHAQSHDVSPAQKQSDVTVWTPPEPPPAKLAAVVDSWMPPQAPESKYESHWGRSILIRSILHDLRPGDVWQYYADKVGLGRKYSTKQLYVTRGESRYGEYLWQDELSDEGKRDPTRIVVNGATSTVTLELRSSGVNRTQIVITATTH